MLQSLSRALRPDLNAALPPLCCRQMGAAGHQSCTAHPSSHAPFMCATHHPSASQASREAGRRAALASYEKEGPLCRLGWAGPAMS